MEKKLNFNLPSPLEQFDWPKEVAANFNDRCLELYVKRDDLIHPYVSGNKWRKLRLNIENTKQKGKQGILTFGGAFSNHLLAVASACHTFNLTSIGIVRGEELTNQSNENLKKCAQLGMQLLFVSREEYTLRSDWDYLTEIKSEYSQYNIVPEGGSNFYGIIGCQDCVTEIELDFDTIWVAQGTCTTSVGVALVLEAHQKAHVVPVLKGFDAKTEMQKSITMAFHDSELALEVVEKVVVHDTFHFGGYAKCTNELEHFIEAVKSETGLLLDKVYTAKAFYALIENYKSQPSITNQKIVFLHTGGLMNG